MAISRDRIEDLWMSGEHDLLARQLAGRRSEWSAHAVDRVRATPCAAALGVLTLLELGDPPTSKLVHEMGRALVACQDGLGCWENPWVTALVLRALGQAELDAAAFARGLAYLAANQQAAGGWTASPTEALHDTAFVLTMLGDVDEFRAAVDLPRAVRWYEEMQVRPGSKTVEPMLEATERQWAVALQRLEAPPASQLN